MRMVVTFKIEECYKYFIKKHQHVSTPKKKKKNEV